MINLHFLNFDKKKHEKQNETSIKVFKGLILKF